MSTLRVRALLPAVSLLALVASRSDAAATYNYTDLGAFSPRAINDQGAAVGNQFNGPPGTSAIYNSYGPNAGRTTTLTGVSNADAINAGGQILGTSTPGGSPVVTDQTTLSNGVAPAGTGASSPVPSAMNDSGMVVGQSVFGAGASHAFSSTGGVLTDLGSLGGASGGSFATAVNGAGQVVGGSAVDGTGTAPYHAFLAAGGKMTDLGTLGGTYSVAYGINASGQVVGSATTDANTSLHAFLATGGKMADLGTLGGSFSIAHAVNAAGQVVGNSAMADGSDHAFVYSDGAMKDLNSLIPPGSPWTLNSAAGINAAGQIIGLATDAGGDLRGFLLTPSSILPPPIPEPGTVAVFGLAAAGLALRAASRRRRAL